MYSTGWSFSKVAGGEEELARATSKSGVGVFGRVGEVGRVLVLLVLISPSQTEMSRSVLKRDNREAFF
jgi:hypothetical protein